MLRILLYTFIHHPAGWKKPPAGWKKHYAVKHIACILGWKTPFSAAQLKSLNTEGCKTPCGGRRKRNVYLITVAFLAQDSKACARDLP